MRTLAIVLVSAWLYGCEGRVGEMPSGSDAGQPQPADAAVDSGAGDDAGPGDAGPRDSGLADAGAHDAGPGDAGNFDAGQINYPPQECLDAGMCPPGQWFDVTPSNLSLAPGGTCGNFGVGSFALDPRKPGDVYTRADCQGIWKSSDYGLTWQGPINTGTSAAEIADCAGGITSPPRPSATPPVLYGACIRGAGIGFWRSTNGGVDWTRYNVGLMAGREDYYAPVIDPYDENHLLMAGHEMNVVAESTNGGQTWSAVNLDPGMMQNGGTGFISFIDTNDPTTTRTTWLWMAQATGGNIGTWRTSNAGTNWTFVEKNEKGHGGTQLYQPDALGVMYIAGVYSDLGWGVLRSTDYGATWAHVGSTGNEQIPFGTNKRVYAMNGWAAGAGTMVDPSLQSAPQPGDTGWSAMQTPAAMYQGPGAVTVMFDGTYSVVLSANYNAGLWRYVEP